MKEIRKKLLTYFNSNRLIQLMVRVYRELNSQEAGVKWVTENIAHLYDTEDVFDNIILYESFHGDSISDAPLAIYLYLSKNEKYRQFSHFFALKSLDHVPVSLSNLDNVQFVVVHSKEYALALVRCKYLINNSTFPNYFHRREKQIYINTWHGIPIKKMFMDEGSNITVHKNSARNFLQATHLLFPNQYAATKLINSSGLKNLLTAQVSDNACFRQYLTEKADVELQREKLALSSSKKVILYAPTWRGVLESSISNENEVFEVVEKMQLEFGDKYEVVLSIHNMAKKHFIDIGLDVKVIDVGVEISEFLSCVDILISDYSSIIFDFLPTGKPILLYVYDKDEYEATRGFYFSLEEFPGRICENLNDLVGAIAGKTHMSVGREFPLESPFYIPQESSRLGELIEPIFDGEKYQPVVSKKKNILTYLGGFRRNGISTSAVNLSKNFDYANNNLIVLTSGADIDKDVEKQKMLSKLDPRCHIIHQAGPMLFTRDEKVIFRKYQQKPDLSKSDEAILKHCFENENRRLLGSLELDAAIDFSGYSVRWALFIAFSRAKSKVIYQHNDMHSERMNKPHYGKSFPSLFAAYKYFDKLVSVSEPTMILNRENISKIYPELEEKFIFVHNPICLEELYSDSQEWRTCDLDGKSYLPVNLVEKRDIFEFRAIPFPVIQNTNFLTIGRFSAEKDHAKLIKAFSKILKVKPDCCLYLVGEGERESELRRLVDSLCIRERVVFTGQLDNPFRLLKLCDCFVLSSNYEGQPMVLLEALCLNKPVIATDIPGSRSVLEDKYGNLVENSIEGLYGAMLEFANGGYSASVFSPEAYVDNANRMFNEKILENG